MEKTITVEQAYRAMFVFVRSYYERKNKPDELAGLLSDLQLLSHLFNDPRRERNEAGALNTADPTSWEDWLEAVETVLRGNDRQ